MAHILIIDDDVSVGVTFARMLEFDGHVVDRVESAQEGLARATAQPPDAIILDMRMPAMNGLDFLREVRAIPALKELPVGILTGDYFLNEAVLGELDTLGATVRYKPVWLEDLSELVKKLLTK